MHDINEIQEKVRKIVSEILETVNIERDQIDVDLSTLGMDSIVFIRIVVALEEAFNIEIPYEFLIISEMNTISKMVDIILYTIANSDMTVTIEK